MFKRLVVALAGALLLSWTCAATGDDGIRFQDVTAATGLARYLEGDPQHLPWRYAHGAG